MGKEGEGKKACMILLHKKPGVGSQGNEIAEILPEMTLPRFMTFDHWPVEDKQIFSQSVQRRKA